MKCTHAANG
jgi:hypothetical protein